MAKKFKHGNAFRKQFENNCIKLLVSAYQETIKTKSIDLTWEENDITAHLFEYIDNSQFRLDKRMFANVEPRLANNTQPKIKGFAAKYSRIDMGFTIFRSGLEHEYFAEACFTPKALKPGQTNTIELLRGHADNCGTITLKSVEVVLFDE